MTGFTVSSVVIAQHATSLEAMPQYRTMSSNYDSHRAERAREAIGDDLQAWLDAWVQRPTQRIYPRHQGLVIRARDGDAFTERMLWSMIPPWLRDANPDGSPKLELPTHNARDDMVSSAPTFRAAWQHGRRCLIPMSAWYEPARGLGRDGWVRVVAPGGVVTAAGLWDRWQPPGGNEIRSYTLITCEPVPGLAAANDRMPVLIGADDRRRWLDDRLPLEEAQALLRPLPGRYALEFAKSA